MTEEMMNLRALLEKSSGADLLREMIGFTAERLMELEVERLTSAAHGERSPGAGQPTQRLSRPAVGNRCRTVDLHIPKVRKGSHFPAVLEQRGLAEKALAAVLNARRLEALSRRSGQRHGHQRHLQKSDQPAVKRDRTHR